MTTALDSDRRRERGEQLDAAAVAGIALCAYLATLAPGITTGDSGELVTAAATLRLAHPTGYPLYLLLGHAWIRALPWISPALAMNALSALFGAAGVAAARVVARELGAPRSAAAAAALVFAFSESFWGEAVRARVYTLSALLFAAALVSLLRARTGAPRPLAFAWLWIGAGLANHSVIAILIPFALWRSARSRAPLAARAGAVACALPGLSLYAYLPWAASSEAIQTWGDPSHFAGFVDYLSRRPYWDQAWVRSAADLWRVARFELSRIPAELGWAGCAVLALGAARMLRTAPIRLAALIALCAANFAVVAWHGSYNDLFHWGRYRIPAWLLLSALTAPGLALLRGPAPAPRWRSAALFALPALVFALHYREADASREHFASDFARRVLEQLEPGALLFAGEDNTAFPITYLWEVEQLRRDIELRWVGSGLPLEAEIDPRQRPVYLAHDVDLARSPMRLLPHGLVYRVWPRSAEPPTAPDPQRWRIASFEAADFGHSQSLDRSLANHYFLQLALSQAPRDPAAALAAARRARSLAAGDPVGLTNAGLFFEQQLEFEEALACFRDARALDPKRALAVQRARFLERALAALERAPSPELRALGLSRALARSGRVELAIRALDQGLDLEPESTALRIERAKRRAERGELEAARADLREVLARDSQHPGALRLERELSSAAEAEAKPAPGDRAGAASTPRPAPPR